MLFHSTIPASAPLTDRVSLMWDGPSAVSLWTPVYLRKATSTETVAASDGVEVNGCLTRMAHGHCVDIQS